ncbi:hypothetical protein AsoHEU7_06450 [Acinetobacter soli]|nr:hypothetical protein AsoHEU7_06450 [Acinetobacter soli]
MFLCSRSAKTCGPFKCLVSSQLAEIASKYLKKDGKVYIESSLRKRKYKDKSGSEKEITEIRADEL